MLFTSKRQFNFPQLTINTNPIFIVNTVTFLGVTYDESMSFKYHIDNVTLKISRHIALLHVLKDYMSQIVLICVYCAHMYPLITYYNLTRCTTYSAYLTPLKLQCKKIVRIITNSNYFAHTDLPPFKTIKYIKNPKTLQNYLLLNICSTTEINSKIFSQIMTIRLVIKVTFSTQLIASQNFAILSHT